MTSRTDHTELRGARNLVPPLDQVQPERYATATFALGCFWEPDACFAALDGVIRTRVGYAGGSSERPTYEALGDHIETVQIDYDPQVIDYDALLEVFWGAHRPEFKSFSRQYMSAIFVHDAEQERRAERALQAQRRGRRWNLFARKVYTEVLTMGKFWPAESYHQKYRLRQRRLLWREFSEIFETAEAVRDSTAAAKANAMVAGYLREVGLVEELGLSKGACSYLVRLVRGELR